MPEYRRQKRYFIGLRLKNLRGKMSQEELAQKIGKRGKTVWRWENDPGYGIKESDCHKIAKVLGLPFDGLVGAAPAPGDDLRIPGYVRVPYLASCPASAGRIMEDEMERWVEFPTEQVRGRKVYLLRVAGDSMNAARTRPILDGDTLFVVADQKPQHGDIVVFRIDDTCTVKRFQLVGQQIVLQPESTNPKHRPNVLSPKQVVLCRGVVESIWNAKIK